MYTAHSGDENYGDGSLSMNHAGMGCNWLGVILQLTHTTEPSGVGSVALGFHNMAGHPVTNSRFIVR